MSKINELKIFYHLTKGPKFERIYKNQEPFFIKYHLEPNQTNINLMLIKKIMSTEINNFNVAEFRYFNPTKMGFVKITNSTSFPIKSKEIKLQIQLKDSEPKELTELINIYKNLKVKLEEYEEIKNKLKEACDKERIDFYFLYAFPLEESQDTDKNSIISYHLEISKFVDIFKSSKKSFNAIFECATVQKLKDAIREQPKVVHISCHGVKSKNEYSLKLEERGEKRDLSKEELEGILSKLTEKLKNIDLVVLSSCHSQVAGDLFFKYGVKNVVYINEDCKVSNTASLSFANTFYQKLIDCNSAISSFNSTIKELYDREKIHYSKNSKCCCNVHKPHNKNCLLYSSATRENIHQEFHEKKCKCNFEEFSIHKNSCEILRLAKTKKYKKYFYFEKNEDNNTTKMCCGCDRDNLDLHHIGESYKFKFKGQNEDCENIIIYKDNKKGKFKKNRNCFIVTDKEMYKDNFLLLIGRRDNVKDIYDKIEDNNKTPFIIIYGDIGVGKYNFAKSVCVYLFERNVITNYYSKKVRSIDVIREEIKSKIYEKNGEKYSNEKYIFILEIDNELQTPINLVNEIINENSILDQRLYFFILLRTKKDKIEIIQKQEKSLLIHLENLSEPKALQLLIELRNVYNFEKNYLTEEQLKKLIELKNYSRKEMYPLLQLIERNDRFEDVEKEIIDKNTKIQYEKREINDIMESAAGKIIFLLNIMSKGLPLSIIKLFEPEFENISKEKVAGKYFYKINRCNWRISKTKINIDDIIPYVQIDKRKQWIEKCLEIFSKILVHYYKKTITNKKQKLFKNINIEYYIEYFFDNRGFWKTFNRDIYEACFIKDENYDKYENIVKSDDIKIDDLKDNLLNLIEVNNEAINDIYLKNKNIKEYSEQIIIMLPLLFIKDKTEFKKILDKLEILLLKKLKSFDKKNLVKIKLLSLWIQENNEINYDEFDCLDREAKAYAYFINGLRINDNKSQYQIKDPINKKKKIILNQQIEKEKNSFKEAIKYFISNTMKSYCYYMLGNLEYEQRHYQEAEKNYKKGKALSDIEKFIKGLLNLKLAKIIIDTIHNKIDNKQKFNDIINELMKNDDMWLINEAKELQKEIDEKLLPDIVLLSSNPLIKGESISFNNKIQAAPNNQYYLMDKIFNRNDINTNLIINYKVLNEDNLREAISGKGKILIIQSDDFNDKGDILLESNIGKSYSLPKEYFTKINKINYDVLVLCYINSEKAIEILKNKVKYLITFDKSCNIIFNDIGEQSLLEYNKLSIDFLEHFIVNITKKDIQSAFEKAYDTFKATFKSFCKQKTDSKDFEKINYITLTMDNQGRIRKNEYIINEKDKENILFIPNPLLIDLPLKFSYYSDYYEDISQIIKSIMNNFEKYYYDSSDKKKKIIEINLYGPNDKDIHVSDNICLKAKQLIGFEIMRFFFRHYENFNSSLFRYYSNINNYINNIIKIKKKREENTSGLGIIIINMKQKNKYLEKIPGFLYIYLSKEPMSNGLPNFCIMNKIKDNEINITARRESNKRKKNKKKKKNNNYQNNKTKNWECTPEPNNSKNYINLTANKYNSVSHFNLQEQKLKSYEDEVFGFTVYDHEENEEDDDDVDDGYFSQDDF